MININDKYESLFEIFDNPKYDDVRYILISGGRGSSKSYTTNLALTSWSYNLDMNILFTRYTLTSASTSVIPEFKDKIDLLNRGDDFTINKTIITNKKSNCNIYFRGIKASSNNNKANLKSLTNINILVFEEAEEIPDFETFERIDLSVRSKKIKNVVLLIFNPQSKTHWLYKHFYQTIEDGFNGIKDDKLYIHTSYFDNIDNLSDSYIKSLDKIKNTNIERYNNVVLGMWNDHVEGKVFSDGYKFIDKFPEDVDYSIGLDFGFSNDPCAIVKIYKHNDKLYLQELCYKTHLTNKDIADKLTELGIGKDTLIIADSAEPKSIEDLRRHGFNVKGSFKGKDSIINGISYIKENEVYIVKSSKNLIFEFDNYAFQKNSDGDLINKPIDKYNHIIDSTRYGLQYFKQSNIITI